MKVDVEPSFEHGGDDLMGSQTSILHDQKKIDLEAFQIAIIGIGDGRNSPWKGVADFPELVRPYLYGLRRLSKEVKILDLGNVLGKTINDRYKAIEEVTEVLVRHSVWPVIIGGSQDYTIPLAGAIKRLESSFRLAVVDAKIDWGRPDEGPTSNGFLHWLISDESKRPYDLSLIAVQKYLYGMHQEEQISRCGFDFLRLGQIKQKGIQYVEPWLRDADLVTFDLTSVKQSDQPAQHYPMPNGLSGEEFCQLSWYAGASDKVKACGFFEFDAWCDNKGQGLALGAQALWHAMEGYLARYNDFPVKDIDEYAQYIVHLNEYELDIKFYNNPVNDRWWVEVPNGEEKLDIVACSRADFEDASRNEIPERWFRFMNKKML